MRDSGLHLLTSEYPPARGGVGDYTRLLARALAARDGTVHVWAPAVLDAETPDEGIAVHRFARFDRGSLREIGERLDTFPGPRKVFVQYVPTSLGARGMNVPLIKWLVARPEELWIQFHEVALGWKLLRRPDLNLVHIVERWMAIKLADRADRIFVAIDAWKQMLGKNAARAETLPVPSNLPEQVEPLELDHIRRTLGSHDWIAHFGTYSPLIVAVLEPAIREIARRRPAVRFLLLGRGTIDFAKRLRLGERVLPRENLSASAVAAHLKASLLALQPFPDGVSTRRGSAMASLALGVPLVSTTGLLTDPLWHEGGVALAPAGRPLDLARLCLELLDDEGRRRALGEQGARLYKERFAMEQTLKALPAPRDARLLQVQ